MTDLPAPALSRRALFAMIGRYGGAAAMYEAMAALAHAAPSTFEKPIALSGAPAGTKVLILGAGLAGMVAAYELRKAGYQVSLLEYQGRPGGRNWTLRGGDRYTELGGFTQQIGFDDGLYLNPGPWRIPHHHRGILHYAKLLGVAMEPFVQLNYNAYVHSSQAFGGRPQRFRTVQADTDGHIAELLAKSTRQGALDQTLTKEDREILLEALRDFGALDRDLRYTGHDGLRRGFAKPPGGGLGGAPVPGAPIGVEDLLRSRLWTAIGASKAYVDQTTMFQPVGGMGRIGEAFGRELAGLIHFDSKIVRIDQDRRGVTVTYEDRAAGGAIHQEKADWCVCTLPASILSQMPMQIGDPMRAAVDQLPYRASCKVGLQFKRRFWEEDEQIYGGVSYTDQPIGMISYPSSGYFDAGKGVLLGAYMFGDKGLAFSAMSPEQRIASAVEQGRRIHPQYATDYECGATVAWHRVPWTLGCAAGWSEEGRAAHYDDLCAIDGRLVLAGEHVSYLTAWQEGAVLSSLNAIERLHQRILAGGRPKT